MKGLERPPRHLVARGVGAWLVASLSEAFTHLQNL